MIPFAHKKILVVLGGRLGDTIFCTPSIHWLHQKFPALQIDALVLTSHAADVLANNPAINQVFITAEKEECRKIAEQYSLVICLHNDGKTPEYILTHTKECWIVPEFITDVQTHPAQQKFNFLQKKLGGEVLTASKQFFLYPQTKDQEKIAGLLRSHSADSKRDHLIGCHLGCHSLTKRGFRLKFWQRWQHDRAWSHANYLKLIRQLHAADPHIRVVLTGTQNEMLLGNKLQRKERRCINLIDKTSVQEMAALMSHLKIFITGDTGPLHVACTSPVNLVVLYGLNVITKIQPYPSRSNHKLIYAPTIGEIRVAEVYQAVNNMLNRD